MLLLLVKLLDNCYLMDVVCIVISYFGVEDLDEDDVVVNWVKVMCMMVVLLMIVVIDMWC